MLSGIGPRETLEQFSIPVVQDLPVGKNLRNHYGITLNFLMTKLNNSDMLNWDNLAEYLLDRHGPMSATGITQVHKVYYHSSSIGSGVT